MYCNRLHAWWSTQSRLAKQYVSMIRKYHNHKLQTTLMHREEEPLNHHETPGRQIKQSNQLSLLHQDDCNTRTDTKQRTTKHRTITDSHNRSNNKQKANNIGFAFLFNCMPVGRTSDSMMVPF